MILIRYSPYLVASILLVTKAFSSPQDLTGNLGHALDLATGPSDLTVQGSLIAIQPNFNAPPYQGSNSYNSGIENNNQIDLHAGNLSPNLLSSSSASAGPSINNPSDNSQNFALLFDDTGGWGATGLSPAFPAPLLDFFPNGLPKFDPDGVIRWFKRPTEPKCDNGKVALCCQQGPARFQRSRKEGAPPPTAEQRAEHAQRLRKCRNWSEDDPACYFPENEACCDCKSERQIAFFCYFYRWRDDPKFQGKPQRPPLELPNPDEVIDPNPTEPNSLPGQRKKKREWSLLDENSNYDGDSGTSTSSDDLYASKPPATDPYKHPGGRLRQDSTCTDEYLEKLGVHTSRYRQPSLHTPENPFQPKPSSPKRSDGRMRINKVNPPPLPIRKPRPPPEEW